MAVAESSIHTLVSTNCLQKLQNGAIIKKPGQKTIKQASLKELLLHRKDLICNRGKQNVTPWLQVSDPSLKSNSQKLKQTNIIL